MINAQKINNIGIEANIAERNILFKGSVTWFQVIGVIIFSGKILFISKRGGCFNLLKIVYFTNNKSPAILSEVPQIDQN
jgi:hypothetical protein